MTDEQLTMRREDHAAIAVLGSQLTQVSTQLGELRADVAHNSKRVEQLEALVRAGTWTVRILGTLGGMVIGAIAMWPLLRDWLKGQIQ